MSKYLVRSEGQVSCAPELKQLHADCKAAVAHVTTQTGLSPDLYNRIQSALEKYVLGPVIRALASSSDLDRFQLFVCLLDWHFAVCSIWLVYATPYIVIIIMRLYHIYCCSPITSLLFNTHSAIVTHRAAFAPRLAPLPPLVSTSRNRADSTAVNASARLLSMEQQESMLATLLHDLSEKHSKPSLASAATNTDRLRKLGMLWQQQQGFASLAKRVFLQAGSGRQAVFGRIAHDAPPEPFEQVLLHFLDHLLTDDESPVVRAVQEAAASLSDLEDATETLAILREVCNMFQALGAVREHRGQIKSVQALNQIIASTAQAHMSVYNEGIALPYERHVRELAAHARAMQQGLSAAEYVKQTYRFFHKHQQIAQSFLYPGTVANVERSISHELLAVGADKLASALFSGPLHNDSEYDSILAQLCSLLCASHEPDVLAVPFAEHFIGMVLRESKKLCSDRRAAADAATAAGKQPSTVDLKFTSALAGVFRGVTRMVTSSGLVKLKAFSLAMDDAWSQALAVEVGAVSIQQLLVAHIDSLLRNSKLTNDQRNEEVSNLTSLACHVPDRDMLEESYNAALARRLLSSASVSREAETTVLAKFKSRFDATFTRKAEAMQQDIRSSAALAQDLLKGHRHVQASFVPMLLCDGVLPKQSEVGASVPFGESLGSMVSLFSDLYRHKYQSRQLLWLPSLGKADIEMRLGSKKYGLQTTVLQALLLELFNVQAEWCLADLTAQTQLKEDEVKRTLHPMQPRKSRDGKKVPGFIERTKAPDGTVVYRVNMAFQSPRLKINVQPPQYETQVIREVDLIQQRRNIVDAAVVRIMKSRTTLTHTELVEEVFASVRSFTLTNALIKSQIASLIEREYMERDEDDPTLYHYLA